MPISSSLHDLLKICDLTERGGDGSIQGVSYHVLARAHQSQKTATVTVQAELEHQSHCLSINFHKLTSGFTQAFKRRDPFVPHEVSIQCDIPSLLSNYCLDVYMYDHCLLYSLLWVSVSVSSICFLVLTLFCLPSGLQFCLLILTKIWEWILTLLTRTSHYSALRCLSTSLQTVNHLVHWVLWERLLLKRPGFTNLPLVTAMIWPNHGPASVKSITTIYTNIKQNPDLNCPSWWHDGLGLKKKRCFMIEQNIKGKLMLLSELLNFI